MLWIAAVTGSRAKETRDALPLREAAAPLGSDEFERLLKFVHEEDRRSYAAAHGGARRLLARILQRPPEALRFSTTAHGKPVLSPPVPALDFSISHARGVVAVAVAQHPVGVDVEPLRAFDGMDGMSDLVLSPQEQANLRSASAPLRPRLFLRYWTLKEALLKAAGAGFSIAPNLITLDVGAAPAALSVPAQLGDPAQWQLTASEL
ncbi:4'-phosphopantetheinyl transferase family protein [Bradyrhizobium prioriisuperbiae]|uniref:4'-phosphopantetheinyl transferase family protein n=1 Tax=Bradyrhizobium prioriisuperbiae TaxID=2854389 RepID=UPI0028EA05B7|nr:4'-phosphopantetheinyl transferase superfamily protein [Bradyrhizobium prioritasuperba]